MPQQGSVLWSPGPPTPTGLQLCAAEPSWHSRSLCLSL